MKIWSSRRVIARAICLPVGLMVGGIGMVDRAQAQQREEDRSDPVLDLPREGFETPVHHMGPVEVTTSADGGITYDSNLFAQTIGKADDFVVHVEPRAKLVFDNDRIRAQLDGRFARFWHFDNGTEDHSSYRLKGDLGVKGERFQFGGGGGFERAAESRNDPEARRIAGPGPRLFNILSGELYAGYQGARLGMLARGTIEKYDFRSAVDDERDFTLRFASLKASYLVSGRLFVFAQGFVNQRAFRLATDNSGVNRDSTSTGALVGVQIDPGGKVTGEFAVGVSHFNPKSTLLKGHTGAEVRGSIVYRPRERTAIMLDAFHGDVATVRFGAAGRTDTRFRLGLQQEARHNFLLSGGIGVRQTRFRGLPSEFRQRAFSVDGEAEYLFNRRVSLALTGRYFQRSLPRPTAAGPNTVIVNGSLKSADAFSRFQVGLEARIKI